MKGYHSFVAEWIALRRMGLIPESHSSPPSLVFRLVVWTTKSVGATHTYVHATQPFGYAQQNIVISS